MIERYATPEAWAEWFKKNEKICISASAIRKRILKIEGFGKKMRSVNGHKCEFFPEKLIRQLCANLLLPLPLADKDGFIEIGGVRHGTANSFAHLFGAHKGAIISHIRSAEISPVRGRTVLGRVRDYYPEPKIRKLCADLLAPLPEADKSGFITVSGVRHGTVCAFARLLGVSQKAVGLRIQSEVLEPLKGKMRGGQVQDFYPEPRIRELCADLLAPLPEADKSGFITVNGVHHGTIAAFIRLLGVERETITSRIRSADIIPDRGKMVDGNVYDFYPEPRIRELCADLLDPNLVQCGSDGFVDIQGIRHGTAKSLARLLGVSRSTIVSRVRSSGLSPVHGKDKVGHLADLWPEPVVRKLCADLVDPSLSVCGPNGLAEIGGVRHGTFFSLSRLLGISAPTIASCLASSGLVPVRGRVRSGNLADLYPEPAVRELCRDVIERKKGNPKP
jgi:hypothetical protein